MRVLFLGTTTFVVHLLSKATKGRSPEVCGIWPHPQSPIAQNQLFNTVHIIRSGMEQTNFAQIYWEVEMAAFVKKNAWVVPAIGFTLLVVVGIAVS